MTGFWFAQLLTGLANAASLFLIASGLSIIFGVTRIVNFAHGSLYMLGAFIAVTLAKPLGFWAAVPLAALAVGLIGLALERAALRWLYRAPELFQLVATFGLVLIIQDATLALWGPEDRFGPRAPGLDRAVRIFGEPIPEYDLFLIGVAPLLLVAIWLLFHRTRWGVLLRAATEDRAMVSALGVNPSLLFAGAFFLGSLLAGLGGALQIPREPASLAMDLNIIAEAFVVVVIGGMGSVFGAYLAAVLISVASAVAVILAPQITLALPFLVMAAVLALRPNGLFGRPGSGHGAAEEPHPPFAPLSPPGKLAMIALLAALAAAPLLAGGYVTVLLTDLVIAALFAASLHFLMGVGGMVSFGHAAWFGLGAYGAALAAQTLGLPMAPSIALGLGAGLLGAALIGWVCVRLSGVYLAMLSLAAAQILWGLSQQWRGLTNGEDGILGVWPEGWAGDKTHFYWIALALCAGGVWMLRRIAHAPLGHALRAVRDAPRRAEASGLPLTRLRWTGFALAGAGAGLAGAVFAYAKGGVFPDALSIATSVDALIMTLLGGVGALNGPLLGAGAFVLIEDWASRLDHWRAIFGAILLGVALLAPGGLAGAVARLKR